MRGEAAVLNTLAATTLDLFLRGQNGSRVVDLGLLSPCLFSWARYGTYTAVNMSALSTFSTATD